MASNEVFPVLHYIGPCCTGQEYFHAPIESNWVHLLWVSFWSDFMRTCFVMNKVCYATHVVVILLPSLHQLLRLLASIAWEMQFGHVGSNHIHQGSAEIAKWTPFPSLTHVWIKACKQMPRNLLTLLTPKVLNQCSMVEGTCPPPHFERLETNCYLPSPVFELF